MLFWIVILGGGFYLAIRLVRALESRNSGGPELDDMRRRMSQLEDAYDAMNRKVERIGESQEFTTRLLTERTGPEPEREPGS
jgi:hypothetical protein